MYQQSLLVVWLDILGHNLDIVQKRMVFLQKEWNRTFSHEQDTL